MNLTLSHQYISQVPESIKDAVFGNVGSLIAFRIGAHDSKRLSSEMDDEWPPRSFVELEPYEILAKIQHRSTASVPSLAITLPPVTAFFGKTKQVIHQTKYNYGEERKVFERNLNRWFATN